MSDTRYRVVFDGTIQSGRSVAEVKVKLSELFKIPADKLGPYFSGRPKTIRSDLDAATAERFRVAFERAGAVLRVEEVEPTPPATQKPLPVPREPARSSPARDAQLPPGPPLAAAEDTAPELMRCPRCNFEQEKAESCAACGVIIAKARPMGAPPPAAKVLTAETPAPSPAPEPQPSEPLAAVASVEYVTQAEANEESDIQDVEATHPPLLEILKIPMGNFLATLGMVVVLQFLVVGILLGPRMLWDFILSHVRVGERRLHNGDLWLGLRPLLWLPLGLALGALALLPAAALLISLRGSDSQLGLYLAPFFALLALFLVLAILHLGLMRSLVGTTTDIDGRQLFAQLFPLQIGATLRYMATHTNGLALGGMAAFCSLFFFTTPIATAITLSFFFSRMEASGHRLHVPVPWKMALKYSLLALPSLGFANLFFIREYLREVLPEALWVPLEEVPGVHEAPQNA